MNSVEFLAWLERMGWSDAEAAAQLRVDRARVFRWRKPQHDGGRAVPPYVGFAEIVSLFGPAEVR